jgi:hypothetical protein
VSKAAIKIERFTNYLYPSGTSLDNKEDMFRVVVSISPLGIQYNSAPVVSLH